MELSLRTMKAGEARPRLMSDRWGIFFATNHPGYPPSRSQTENLRDPAKAWGQKASQTYLWTASDLAATDRVIAAVSVLGLNRVSPSAPPTPDLTATVNQYRILIDSFALADRRRPAISATGFSLTNLTGAFSDLAGVLDPPEDAGTSYAPTRLEAISNASNTVVTLQFDNHHAAERALTGTLRFRVYAMDSVLITQFTNITVVLRQGGSDVATLAYDSCEIKEDGYVFNYSYPVASLPSSTGTLGLRITGTTTGTSVPEFLGVEAILDLAGLLYNSGWVNEPGAGVRVRPGITISAGQGVYTMVEFSDFHLQAATVVVNPIGGGMVGVFAETPMASGLTVGRYIASEVITLAPSSSDGRDFWNVRPVHGSERARKRGGGLRTRRGAHVYKEAETRGVFKLESEAMDSLLHSFYDVVGPNVPVLVMPHADRPQDDLWAVIERWDLKGAGVAAGADGTGRRYDLDASFIEYTAKIAGR